MLKKSLKAIMYATIFIVFLVAGITAWTEIESGSLSYSPKPTIVSPKTAPAQDEFQVNADTNGISEANQKPGNNITLDFLIDRPGYLVVFEYDTGQAGQVIGTSELLTPGPQRDFTLQLKQTTRANQVILAKLYAEQNSNQTFDIKADRPIQKNGGGDVSAIIIVTE